MKTEEILFILTFVFGTIWLIAALFQSIMTTITGLFLPEKLVAKSKLPTTKPILYNTIRFIDWLGGIFTVFSLCYQVWFWFIVKLNILN